MPRDDSPCTHGTQLGELQQASFSEEMRLVYVAMTRAREHLYLTNLRSIALFGQDKQDCKPAGWFEELSACPDICQARPVCCS